MRIVTTLLLAGLPGMAGAHAFGQSYVLPVPFSLYAWGGVAALLLSFLVAAGLLRRPLVMRDAGPARPIPAALTVSLRSLALAALALTMTTGWLGPQDPYLNAAMTLFWILFVLGLAYLTALTGDVFSGISPWLTLVMLARRLSRRETRIRLPAGLGCWPAVFLYAGFIAMELFADPGPRGLATLLLAYTAGMVIAGWWLGPHWLEAAELFSRVLALFGRCAPLQWEQAPAGLALRWRWPLQGLMTSSSRQPGEVVLILLILAATAYDGLHTTQVWAKLYWETLFGWLQPWLGDNLVVAWPVLKPLHAIWELISLLLAPLLYLAAYLAALALARQLTGSRLSLRLLARRFAPSLLPIALVYHISHYFTLLLTQGPQIGWLMSDPFALGWQLRTGNRLPVTQLLPAMGTVWHVQVGLILTGHAASVALAHHEALRCFGNARAAWRSQLPMLLLMMGMTVSGLWILAQPINPG